MINVKMHGERDEFLNFFKNLLIIIIIIILITKRLTWHLVVELQGHVTVTKQKPRKRRV